MSTRELRDAVTIVTGASGSLGGEPAAQLAAAGGALVERTVAEYGRLDVLINNAAVVPRRQPTASSSRRRIWPARRDASLRSAA